MKQPKALKTELMKTAILLAIVGVCVAGFWLALRAALRTEYPLHAVITESMVPTLQVGDLLVVQGINASRINAAPETGDIIVFRKPINPSEFIVHRAVAKTRRGDTWYLTTKGDYNAVSFPWETDFPEYYVIGKVVGRVPLLGYIKIFLDPERNPVGIALFIILILILLFADYIPLLREKFGLKTKPL